MTRSIATAALVATALVTPLLGAAPASATHTLCDNEPTDIHDPLDLGIGVDRDDVVSRGDLYICAGDLLVLVDATGPDVTACLSEDPSHPTDGYCVTVP